MPEPGHPQQLALQSGCRDLGLQPTPDQYRLLLEYLDLLLKWNKAYNLTAIRDPRQMVAKHLLDSLALAPHLIGERLIDVGTGAGLPGIPLAILFPGRAFHLLDSNGKKTRFLFQVKTALGLDNMTVHHARVESPLDEPAFDAVLSRAFASLVDMVSGCGHLLGPEGRFLAMKGTYPEEELVQIAGLCDVQRIISLDVPGLQEQRHLVELTLKRD